MPVAEVVRRQAARGSDEAPERRTIPAVPARSGSATLRVTVLRQMHTPTREVRQVRTLRIEPGRGGAPGPVGAPGSAGPVGAAGAPGRPGTVMVVRQAPVAAPVPAAPVTVHTPPAPLAGTAGPGWPADHLEDVAARVLRSIERRATAQRERMGRP
jgi:hypothetical protein